MHRLFRIFVLLSCAGFVGGTAAQSKDADALAAQAAVRAFHDALRRGDVEAVGRLLAADAVILENGSVESRDEYLRHHLGADIEFAKAVPSKVTSSQATVAGETAWVRSSSATEGTFRNRAVKLTGAELVVLTRGAAGWQIRAVHWSSVESK